MTQTQTVQQKTIGKRRSFSAWLRRKMSSRGGVRKITPRVSASPAETRNVFGVPLCESIQYARQTISYQDEDGTVYRQAGAIPTVVAKTGLFLKQNALQTEGIFRLSGSLKRVAALQEIFDKPLFGADVDWEGITVHDAATLLRRYLNQLPDPVITHEYYQPFRDVMNDKSYNSIEERIDAFQALIEKLPLPHQQLLLYLLDMLNLFARNEQETRMDASNLAAIFCPSMLSHPSHNTPVQYKISQRVIEFLIEFQALFTMQMVVNKNTKNHDDVPPVPVLPDWVGATFIAEKKVPPLDMETVHRLHDDQPPLDSGTDVKTPAPFHIKDEDSSSTPRRIPSPPTPSPDSNNAYDHARSLYNAYCKGNPVALSVTIGVGLLLTLATGYGGYRAMTLRNMINIVVFFGGLTAFWTMLMQGVETEKKPVEGDFEDQTAETLMEQDRATEEAMMKDESLMAEWGDLMNRSWKNDPSTPSVMLMRRNSSSDYFGQKTPTLEDNDDNVDQASMLSIASRFNEEQQSSSDDDYDDEDWSPDLAEDELQKLWLQFEQMEKDKDLAEKLQREEDAAERKRDEATNPFLVQSPISPKNTDQETWKIASRPQKQ